MITAPEAEHLDAGLKRLWDLYRAQQYARLLTEAEQIAKAAGGTPSPTLMGLVAMGLLGLEQPQDALRTARIATAKTRPQAAWLYRVLAEAEYAAAPSSGLGAAAVERARHLAAAVAAAQVANRMLPGQVAHLAAASRFLRAAGDLAAATAMARQAIAADPAQADGHLEMGLCHARAGQTEAALAAFRLAQSADPRDARGYLEAGRALLAPPTQLAAARAALRRALAIDPSLDAAEDALVTSVAGPRRAVSQALRLVVGLARLNLLGMSILAFLYYVAYRLLQMLGWALPATWPVARVALQAVLAAGLAALASGKILRWWLRRPPTPRSTPPSTPARPPAE